MTFSSKVIWSEGMFIRAQHFQQSARYFERLVRARVSGLRAYDWGLTELRLNRALLATGRFAVERAAGIFPDGTPFAMPDDADHPPPLLVPPETRDAVLYLTVPISQPGGFETSEGGGEPVTRYVTHETDVASANAGQLSVAPIQVGRLRLRYALEGGDLSGMQVIGLARIQEVRADNSVAIDDSYIPPLLTTQAGPHLSNLVNEVVGLLHHRGEAIAARLSAGSAGTASEVVDTLMLQAINRWQPLMTHLSQASGVHPETVYQNLVSLVGELTTFTSADRRPRPFAPYVHDQLQPTFAPLVAALRQALSAILDQSAMAIPLVEHRYGIRVAQVPDRSMFAKYTFFLAAKADIPQEQLLRGLVGQVKVGPVEQIRELVNTALPGIPLRALPVAPRQIPYHVGKSYCELDRSNPLWRQVAGSSGMALHVGGDFPGLELELWAVKD